MTLTLTLDTNAGKVIDVNDTFNMIRKCQQIAVAFWHQASDDDWGTLPEHWALLNVIEYANVAEVKAYNFRRIADSWIGDQGGVVSVHVRRRIINGQEDFHIEYAGWHNSQRPREEGVTLGCTYNAGARLEWRYGDPRTHYYDDEVGYRVVGGDWDQRAEIAPAPVPRPENFGEWS